MQYETIKEIGGLDSISDSTDVNKKHLRVAENLLLRPIGGAKRIPPYQRLWALNNLATYNAGLGLTSGSGTCLLQIVNEGKVILAFWDVANSKTLGVVYAGDTGLFSSPVTLTDGGSTVTVLKSGLAASKRWYCYRFYDEIWMGNGVDANLIYQYSRTSFRLRTAGTNEVPSSPLLSAVAPLATANVQANRTIAAAAANMVFTADTVNFPGTNGNNIRIAIAASGVSQVISSTRTGAGTSASPFQFTFTLGTRYYQSSANAIKLFIDNDSNCEGILSVDLSGSDDTANPSLTSAMTALSGGVDATTSVGFPVGDIKKFATTYWDPGINGAGFESAMSVAQSITISASNKDVSVKVTANTAGELARFGYQKIYLLVGSTWQCVKTVANATASFRIGTDLSISGTYSTPQKRIPPCTMFELFKGKMWAAGNPGNPSRVWISKFADTDELIPEGTDITNYLEITGRTGDPDSPVISCMLALSDTAMSIGTQKTITAVNGTSFARSAMAGVSSGPINPMCFASWEDSHTRTHRGTPYLGTDGQLHILRGYSAGGDGQLVDDLTVGTMREVVDVDAIRRNPQRANLNSDPVNRMIWIWVPNKSGSLSGFVMDLKVNGLTGPFDWPKLVSSTSIGMEDTRIVGCDEIGNLFVFDAFASEYFDPYDESDAFTYQDSPYTPPAEESGYGTVTLDAGVLRKASTTVLKTGFLDLGKPNMRKGFYSLEWTTIRNSRALVSVTLTSDLGHTVTRAYGDVYGRERHKVVFCLSGHAIQIAINATTAEDCDFAIRDITVGFEIQGTR